MPRNWLRWSVAAVVLAVVGVGALAGYRLMRIADDLRDARDLIESAGAHIEAGELSAAQEELRAASRELLRANTTLYTSPDVSFVSTFPVIGHNVRSLRASVSLAYRLVQGGDRILQVSAPLQDENGRLQVPLRDGRLPLETLAEAEQEVATLARSLSTINEAPSRDDLIGSVADLQDRVFEEATERRRQLIDVAQALALVREIGGGNGPRRYLIAVANTAEMRGTGGMILSYGVLEGNNGDFQLPAFGRIDELFLETAPAIDIPESERERWAGLDIDRLWRNANMIPDIEIVAPRLLTMYQAATGLHADGVIEIDAAGLGAILRGIGPVDVEGVGTVSADNVVDLTLNQAYSLFPDRDQRQEVLGDVAEVVFDRLVNGEYESLRPLGEAMLQAAAERHVMLVPSSAHAARAAAFFGATGALPAPDSLDHLLLSVQNFSGNKLDYYVDTALHVTGSRPELDFGELGVDVTVTNTAPADGAASYVFGPNLFGLGAGDYRTVVSLYVPNGTNLVGASGGSLGEVPVLDTEGKRTVVTYAVTLPAGASSTVHLDLTLAPRPAGPYALSLVPLPRVRPTSLSVDLQTGGGREVQDDFVLNVPTTLTDRGEP